MNEEESYVNEVDDAKSPLFLALKAHFQRHYNKDGSLKENPYGSRNRVAPPLNLDLMNSSEIKELSHASEEGFFKEDR
jgi:hypothetical protein